MIMLISTVRDFEQFTSLFRVEKASFVEAWMYFINIGS